MALDIKDTFLIEASRTGHGDIQKTVNIMEICNALSLTREQIERQKMNLMF
jgi:hypothetical protein